MILLLIVILDTKKYEIGVHHDYDDDEVFFRNSGPTKSVDPLFQLQLLSKGFTILNLTRWE